MKGSRTLFLLLVVFGAAILAVALSASASRQAIAPIPAFTSSQLISEPSSDWITARGDAWNRQYSSLSQINKSNVSGLRVAWHTRVAIPTKGKANFTGALTEAEPVIYQGTVYMPDTKGNVYAFDAVTGERQWYYKPKYPKGFAAGLPTARGVVIGDGKVYMAQTDGSIVGLDQSTGRVVWKTVVGNFKKGFFFTSPPTYINDRLIVGTSGGDFGALAKVVSLNAQNGKIQWSWNVIPTGSQRGSNTWPAHRAYTGGGAVWAQLPVDPSLNSVYVGVGNPVPYNGNVRGNGKEYFTESIVALNMTTGKFKWAFQEVHHDIWDYDTAANPIVVFDINYKGHERHALAQAGKTGWVYILDRTNGKPLIGIPEKAVPQSADQHTWPTQPIPKGQPFAAQCPRYASEWTKWKAPDGNPVKVACIYTPYNEKQYTAFAPSALGGTDWPPSSFSSQTGLLYVCSKDSESAWKALPKSQSSKLKPLGNFFQIDGLFAQKNSPATKTQGKVVAMSMTTNRRVWVHKFPLGDLCYSGVMSTAGGLVFVGRNDRHLEAYDAYYGKLLWRSPKLAASVAAPPATYELNGKQYVAVYAGGNSIASGSGTKKVTFGSDLYTFALP